MTLRRLVTLVAGGAIMLSMPLVTLAQGAGGSGGGGSGGSTVGSAAGALYGDLYVIERDGNGAPVLAKLDATGGPYYCQQPLAKDCRLLDLNGEKVDFDPELEDACAVQAADAPNLQSVVFGRESVSRAPATVIDHSYAEAIKTINLAAPDKVNCGGRAVKLDPAGRIELCLPDASIPPVYAWKTIDSPLENLGLYRAVMTAGCLNLVTDEIVGDEGVRITEKYFLSTNARGYFTGAGLGHLVCASDTTPEAVDKADMISAAVFVAAGADKFVPVSLDQIVNVNNTLGINKWTYTTSRKVKTLTITYFPFKVADGPGGWFAYTKGSEAFSPTNPDNTVPLLTINGVTAPTFSIASVPVFGGPPDGVELTSLTVCRNGSPLTIDNVPVADGGVPVACDAGAANPIYSASNIYGCGGANWFAQLAEHARKTIWYLHNFEPPALAH